MQEYIKDMASTMDVGKANIDRLNALDIIVGLNDGKEIDVYLIGDLLFNGRIRRIDLVKAAVGSRLFLRWYILTKISDIVRLQGKLDPFATSCYVLNTTIDTEYIAKLFRVSERELTQHIRSIFGTGDIEDIRYNRSEVRRYCMINIAKSLKKLDITTKLGYAVYLILNGYSASCASTMVGIHTPSRMFSVLESSGVAPSVKGIIEHRSDYERDALNAYMDVKNYIRDTGNESFSLWESLMDGFIVGLSKAEQSNEYHSKDIFKTDISKASEKITKALHGRLRGVIGYHALEIRNTLELDIVTDMKILRYESEHEE